MKIAFITPPLLQPNTPYPAMPILSGWFRKLGFDVKQYDFSLKLLLRMLSPDVIDEAVSVARKMKCDDALNYFLESADDYKRTLPNVIAFLQGRNDALAWRISARTYLPEGPYFASLDPEEQGADAEEDNLAYSFGNMGTIDKAKYLCSLYLDDFSSFISRTIAPDFQLGKYAEKLSVSLPSFAPLRNKLESNQTTIFDRCVDDLTQAMLDEYQPDWIALSIPFPGTLYGAFRVARYAKLHSTAKVVIGGGYVNSELRELNDKSVFDYIDHISYDEGFSPLYKLFTGKDECPAPPEVLAPDYTDLNLHEYFPVTEMPNPMHRIWTDGRWIKMQVTRGCYWHKCAFCDLALDYICRYAPASAKAIVDSMEQLVANTGLNGFHFVDEAIAPNLIRSVCQEILQRKLCVTWWGNIRFDAAFTPELTELMADAGCIAVTGGLECAENRLLKLMNKGITIETAEKVMHNFHDAGIMVHAYLMYAFPTETKNEAIQALEYVRRCFASGCLQSAFWHRFALTAHSAIAKNPEQFKITVPDTKQDVIFARNEIPYMEKNAPDWNKIGDVLQKATYNFMLGRGLDIPAKNWF